MLIALLCLMSSCASIEKEEALEKTDVTLRLQWQIQGQFAGYLVAKEKGYYADAGLNVDIQEGGFGKNCIETVKSGVEEFGITKWVSFANESNLVSVAQIVKDSGTVFVSKKKLGIDKPSELKGKKIGLWFAGNEFQLYALLAKYNMNTNDVKIMRQNYDMNQFTSGTLDVVSAMTYNELLTIYEEGYKQTDLNIINSSDYGVPFPGESIFTSKEYLKNHPDIVRKFVAASIEGWQYVIKHPDEAAKIVMKYDKENRLTLSHQRNQINEMIKLLKLDQYKKIGIHNTKEMERLISIYSKYEIIKKGLKPEDISTNQFIQ